MRGLIEAAGASGSAWSYGGAILTFLFPMILFIIVAVVLYVLYSTPHLVPGHRYLVERRAVTGTGPVQAPSGGGPPQGTMAEGGPPQGTMGEGGPPQGTMGEGGPPQGTMGEGGQTAPAGNPEDTE